MEISSRTKNHDAGLCPGAICVSDDTAGWQENVIWYPGEPVCGRKPYSKVQRKQIKINRFVKAGKFRNLRRYFTYRTLEEIGRITSATKGSNPELDHDPDRKASVGQKSACNKADSTKKPFERYVIATFS